MRWTLQNPRCGYPLLAMVCLAVSLLLGWTAYGQRINNIFFDLYFRHRGAQKPSSQIVIAAIDDATLSAYGPLPLDRSRLAQGIAAIRAAQPSVIALDLLLTDRGPEEADQELETALAGSAPRTLAEIAVAAAQPRIPVVLAAALSTDGSHWLRPQPGFALSAAAIGHVHVDPGPDGVSRQVLLEKEADHQRYWALALECFRLWLKHSPDPVTETDDGLQLDTRAGPMIVPATRAGQRALLINYAGDNGTFPEISFARLGSDPSVAARLKDKIVLVGVTAQASGDRVFTPFSAGVGMAGVEVHANILDTLLSGAYLLPVRESKALLGILAVVLGALWGMARLPGYWQGAWLTGMGLFVVAAPYDRFLEGQVWPGFSLLLAFGTTLVMGEAYQIFLARHRFRESERRRRQSQQRFEMAAHEMRTPLAAIQASSELLVRYPLEGARRDQMVQLLYEESQRLGRLVERFLSVERLSAGEMELRRSSVELGGLLAAVCERLRPLAERKRVQLVLQETAAPVPMEADAELLEFAVSNLVTNAVKYSPEGSAVTIACERAGRDALIHISDQGPGLSPEESRHVFERFYRTEGASRSAHPGFGLGLGIAREIARHHGGDIRIESKPGAGCRFSLVLPLAVPSEAPKAVSP